MNYILVIDDDEDDRDFLLSVLALVDHSLKCTTAENGSVALRQLTAEQLLPDLIFLDLNMPVMNGKQFLTEIKAHERLKNIPVIILSTSSDQNTISESLSMGAADFITKPNKLSLLEERVREIVNNPLYS